jgi:hypothetical protein
MGIVVLQEANRNNKTGNRSIFFTFTKLLFLYFNN